MFFLIFFKKCNIVNIKITLFLLAHFNNFFNNNLFFKFINKCQKEIVRCSPPSSYVYDFILYMFKSTWLHIINNWGWHLYHTGFSLLFVPHLFSFIVCFVSWWSYMHGHFGFCHLTGNIVISSNCSAKIYKSYRHGHFHFHHLIGNNVVSVGHNLSDTYRHMSM